MVLNYYESFLWRSVDTPFLTVLKTWTSPFEHSVIIHFRVRFEFPEVSATRLASGSLNSVVLCLVGPNTCWFLLWKVENGLLAIPMPHQPWLEATGCVFLPLAIGDGRSALCVGGRPVIWSMDSFSGRYHIFVFLRHCACQLCQLECMPVVPAGAHIPVLHPRVWRICTRCTLCTLLL